MKQITIPFLICALLTVFTTSAATINVPIGASISAAIATAQSDDILQLDTGTYNEAGITVTKPLTIRGAGVDSTVIDPAGSNGFAIESDNVTLENMTIRNGSTGIRMASSTVVDGLTISSIRFLNHANSGFSQSNNNSSGHLRNLHIDNCEFQNAGFAVYCEEIRDSVVENSSFTGNSIDVYVFKNYESAGVPMDDVIVQNNLFTDTKKVSVLLEFGSFTALGTSGFSVLNNTCYRDVATMTANSALFEVILTSGFDLDHGPVIIDGNTASITGTFTETASATTVFGVKLLGGLENVHITNNQFDGGDVDSIAGVMPVTSGINFTTTDGIDFITETSNITINGNTIFGFEAGVFVHDPLTGSDPPLGALLEGTQVTVHSNSMANELGIQYGSATSSAIIDASSNWWGTADGAVVANGMVGRVDFTPFLDADTDTDGNPINGFQGDTSSLHVTAAGQQTGAEARIEEGLSIATAAIILETGTYDETVTVAQSNFSFRGATAVADDVHISVDSGTGITITGDNVAVANLRVTGAVTGIVVSNKNTVSLSNLILNNLTDYGFSISNVTAATLADLQLTANGMGGGLVNTVTNLTISGSSDGTADQFVVDGNQIVHQNFGPDPIFYTNVGSLTLSGGSGDDQFLLSPPAIGGTEISVDGGDPATGEPGDSMLFNESFPAPADNGTQLTGNFPTISYVGIETKNTGVFPVISCVPNIYVQAEEGATGAIVQYQLPECLEECTGTSVNPTDPGSPTTGSEFPIGVTPQEFVAISPDGNRVYCRFTVEVTAFDGIFLVPGWNLISVRPSDLLTGLTSLRTQLADKSMWGWNEQTQRFIRVVVSASDSVLSEQLSPTKGIWVYRED